MPSTGYPFSAGLLRFPNGAADRLPIGDGAFSGRHLSCGPALPDLSGSCHRRPTCARAGWPRRTARAGQPRWSGYTPEDHYHYMATEIAFCHAGYVDSPELFDSSETWLDWAERETRLVAPIHRLCASARPVKIRYRVDGDLVPVERAVAAGQLEQVFVEYDNGLRVYVNRHPAQPWPVELDFRPSWADFSALADGARRDFVGAPQTTSFVLPPNGWLAAVP